MAQHPVGTVPASNLDWPQRLATVGWCAYMLFMPMGNTSLAILLLLISVIAVLCTPQGRHRWRELVRTDRFTQVALLFIGTLYLATLFSPHWDLGLVRSTIYLLIIMVPLLANHLVQPLSLEWFANKGVKLLTIGAIISCGFALYQRYMLGIVRPGGPFTRVNGFATVLMIVMVITWHMLSYPPAQTKKSRQVLLGAAWLVMLWTLFLTGTRGAWIGLVFALFLAALHNRRRALTTLGVIALAILAVAVASPSHLHRVGRIFSIEGNMDRIHIWQGTWRMILDHPLLGIGPDGFIRVYEAYRPVESSGHSMAFAHNLFLAALAETGIVGTLALIAILGTLTVLAIRWLRYMQAHAHLYNARTQALARGVFIALAAVFVREQVDNTILGMEIGGAFWILVSWVAYKASSALAAANRRKLAGHKLDGTGQGRVSASQ